MIFFFEQRLVDLLRRLRRRRRTTNSLKNGPLNRGFELAGQVVRLGQILLGQFAQALLAVDAS